MLYLPHSYINLISLLVKQWLSAHCNYQYVYGFFFFFTNCKNCIQFHLTDLSTFDSKFYQSTLKFLITLKHIPKIIF